MNYKRLSETGEVLTVAEIKQHLRIYHSEQDSFLQSLINSAKREIERRANVVLLPSVFEFTIQTFETSLFPVKPLQSITKIEYYDEAGNLQTLAASKYELLSRWPRAYDKINFTDAPGTDTTKELPIIITAAAGYDTTPADLKAAIMLLVGTLYNNSADPVHEKTTAVDRLLKGYK